MIRELLGAMASITAEIGSEHSYPFPLAVEIEALRRASTQLKLRTDFTHLHASEPESFGGEHYVWYLADEAVVLKATRNDRYGLLPDPHRSASPSDYLHRLLLVNEVFGDNISVEGVWEVGNEIPRIVTRQQFYPARKDAEGNFVLPSQDEIDAWLTGRGFRHEDHDCIEGGLWKLPYAHGSLVVADLLPKNAVILDSGDLVFFDVVAEWQIP